MNTILLEPTDVLFFRDGRPMGGASSGHGAAWPLPSVINHAFHAALHRSDIPSHRHVPGRSSEKRDYSDQNRADNGRHFGSLTTAGPFPVKVKNKKGEDIPPEWHFPRPLDADDSRKPVLAPIKSTGASSLPSPLLYPVASTKPPSKHTPAPWWSISAWRTYLDRSSPSNQSDPFPFLHDRDFSDTEHAYGIEIAADTGSVVDRQFYSAHYLRLRSQWRLGVHAQAPDKAHNLEDIIPRLIQQDHTIVTGGQQRTCTACLQQHAPLTLPRGAEITGTRVKWVLLSPAIFPAIGDHPGGWLPSWIRHIDGQVMLKSGDTDRQRCERRDAWRERVKILPAIHARLVAAIVGKPVTVTGWALPNEADPDHKTGGAKSTHLAVPAGSVYYFEAESPEDARALATALNWHGDQPQPTTIANRRSTLMGEKGFGLGLCGTWDFFQS